MKFSAIMIGSENSKKLAEFYTKVFGEPGWQQDDWYGYDVGGAYIMLGNHSEVKGTNMAPARIMINFETTELKADFERIKELGAEIIAEPYMPSEDNKDMWLATFADPDGNYLQLATPMPS